MSKFQKNKFCSINEAFDKLRHRLPWLSNDRKMSKAKTLREAIRYIKQLSQLLNNNDISSSSKVKSSYVDINAKTEQSSSLSLSSSSSLIIPNFDGIFLPIQ